jgi:cysteine desulfurase family protein
VHGVGYMSYYFDNAATTFPKPEIVYSYMDSFYRQQGGNSGRGQYKLAAIASKMISETRGSLQTLLQCKNKDVVFTPSATIALNMVIQGMMSDVIQTVYITPFEHNAVTRVLHHFEKKNQIVVKQLEVTKTCTYDLNLIQIQFEKLKPDMVIVSHASNVCGLVAPVLEIFNIAKKYDAITITDIAQTAGLLPLNTGNELIDFATFAGHKTLYGPFGIGGFVKKKNCNPLPILFGGTGIESANQDMPETIPVKYEPGSQNSIATAGLYAALKWFTQNQDIIRKKENTNHKRLIELLKQYDFIHIVGPKDRSNCIGVVSCVFDNYSADNIGDVLDEFEIAVRTGLDCSPLAHKFLGTFPAGTVRFSAGYFTNDVDFEKLKGAFEYIRKNR